MSAAGGARSEETYSFDVEEFSKQPFEQYGYVEGKLEHADRNQDSALASLAPGDQPATQSSATGTLRYGGSYVLEPFGVHWLLTASGRVDDQGWIDDADAYEAYVDARVGSSLTGAAGKKSYQWGKGYAWNPVGFINRPKDPNDPEEAREGYIIAEADLVKSFTGPLRTASLTTVLLPVWQGINDDFGKGDALNAAVKLYLLYRDTDIDIQVLAGGSRSERYGIDFSRNLSTNFEVHGELAYFSETERAVLTADNRIERSRDAAFAGLVGLRYLTSFDLTTIIEYYHNGAGYDREDTERFYSLIDQGALALDGGGADALLDTARQLSLQGYTRPNPGTDYLYARFSLKEPGNILYFTPALTAVYNLQDDSFSMTPELIYTGLTNWEARLRFSLFGGGAHSEFGEKINSNRLELRLRRFF